MNEKHFSVELIAKLRSKKRIALLDPKSVVAKCMDLAEIKSGKILDIGTGTGLFAEYFQAMGFSVTGIDDSEIMIQEAQRLLPDISFIKSSAEKVPFNDNDFEFSFMAHLLHEVENPIAVLREAKRISKHSLFILEWSYRDEEIGPPLKHRISENSMKSFFEKAGLGECYSLQMNNMILYYSK